MKVDSKYVPSQNYRSIVPVEVTDEQLNEAVKILKEGIDSYWDSENRGFMLIGVTGRHRVFYTFWKYNPKNRFNPLIYLGNLSTNIVEAAKKARKFSGIQPIYFDSYDTLTSLRGTPEDVLTFGKYRGKTLGEIYLDNPQYIIWLSKNMEPRSKKQFIQLQIAKDLTQDYFDQMTKINRESDDSEYYGEEGDKVDLVMKITYAKIFDLFLKLRGEYNNYRFEFYINNLSNLEDLLNAENSQEIIEKLENKEFHIKGKIKGHKEILGKKYTQLHYVKILNE